MTCTCTWCSMRSVRISRQGEGGRQKAFLLRAGLHGSGGPALGSAVLLVRAAEGAEEEHGLGDCK